jgi:hypothetical protein
LSGNPVSILTDNETCPEEVDDVHSAASSTKVAFYVIKPDSDEEGAYWLCRLNLASWKRICLEFFIRYKLVFGFYECQQVIKK